MRKEQRLQEKLATYRDLNPAGRRRLQAELEGDPDAAELLAAYQEMDRRLAELPRPTPSGHLRRDFFTALDRETAPGKRMGIGPLLRHGPALATRAALGAILILALFTFAYLFRQQLQLATAPPTGTPTASVTALEAESLATPTVVAALPEPEGINTPTPTPASPLTPTPAVTVDPDDPFAPFRLYMAAWPEQTGMAYGALRAGMTAYLQQLGSIEALADPAVAADLQAQVAPAVEGWSEQSIQLLELVESGRGRELIVAVLPLVDVYRQDSAGVFHVEGVGLPRHWPVQETWPQAVEAVDFNGDGSPELVVTYRFSAPSRLAQEVLVVEYEPARRYWSERLRLPVADLSRLEKVLAQRAAEVVTAFPASSGNPGRLEKYCLAYGAFDSESSFSAVRREIYAWYGDGIEPLLFDRTEPSNLRQYVNLTEAHLQEGELREALRRYRLLAEGEIGLPNADAVRPNWEAFAALRAGQLHALLGEPEAAREVLGRALLSSGSMGRLAGIFAGAYERSSTAAGAWAALLGDGSVYQESYLGDGSGEPAAALPVLYPGLALAAALRQAQVPQAAGLQVPDLLTLWAEHGLMTTGRVLDIDLDGAPEIVAAQLLLDEEAPALAPVWVLDVGNDGWFAALLGELPAGWTDLQLHPR